MCLADDLMEPFLGRSSWIWWSRASSWAVRARSTVTQRKRLLKTSALDMQTERGRTPCFFAWNASRLRSGCRTSAVKWLWISLACRCLSKFLRSAQPSVRPCRRDVRIVPAPDLSAYRLMWMMVLFDLPVMTKEERKVATNFRKFLLDLGFPQWRSIVATCAFARVKSRRQTKTRRVERRVPSTGKVHIVFLTDRQYEMIISFDGRLKEIRQKNPTEYVLF